MKLGDLGNSKCRSCGGEAPPRRVPSYEGKKMVGHKYVKTDMCRNCWIQATDVVKKLSNGELRLSDAKQSIGAIPANLMLRDETIAGFVRTGKGIDVDELDVFFQDRVHGRRDAFQLFMKSFQEALVKSQAHGRGQTIPVPPEVDELASDTPMSEKEKKRRRASATKKKPDNVKGSKKPKSASVKVKATRKDGGKPKKPADEKAEEKKGSDDTLTPAEQAGVDEVNS